MISRIKASPSVQAKASFIPRSTINVSRVGLKSVVSTPANAVSPALVCGCQSRRCVCARAAPTATVAAAVPIEVQKDLNARHREVLKHFSSAMAVDDFIARTEVALSGFGFTGDNTIAMTNLCRDEVTTVLKDKIESVFGSSFNTNGLGGVLTCGVIGMKAGLSHSPTSSTGRERYVFFAFPHIAINSAGEVGAISRPGRAGKSCACGALAACLGQFQAGGYAQYCKVPGEHDVLDPEFSILRQRLARRLRYEQTDVSTLNLTNITAAAQRTITDDLEYLIEKAVGPNANADYAVVTGVQIHNWAADLEGEAPSMEFVAPAKVYAVVNGVKVHLDLGKVPLMASVSDGSDPNKHANASISSSGAGSTMQEIPYNYLSKKLGGASGLTPAKDDIMNSGSLEKWPAATVFAVKGAGSDRDPKAPTMDSDDEAHPSFEVPAVSAYAVDALKRMVVQETAPKASTDKK